MSVSPDRPRKIKDRDLAAAGFALLILLAGLEGWRRQPVSGNVLERTSTTSVFDPNNPERLRDRRQRELEDSLWIRSRFEWPSLSGTRVPSKVPPR